MNKVEKLLSIVERDCVIDVVSLGNAYLNKEIRVTRRAKVISEIKNIHRLILVEVDNGFELRSQTWGCGWIKDGWCNWRTTRLSEDEVNKIKEAIDSW